jgi:hypothetical protein
MRKAVGACGAFLLELHPISELHGDHADFLEKGGRRWRGSAAEPPRMVWRCVAIRKELQSGWVLPQGEPHAGERPHMDVWAGPLAKQDCAATRWQRTESERRVGVTPGRERPLTRRCRARAGKPEQPGHRRKAVLAE